MGPVSSAECADLDPVEVNDHVPGVTRSGFLCQTLTRALVPAVFMRAGNSLAGTQGPGLCQAKGHICGLQETPKVRGG